MKYIGINLVSLEANLKKKYDSIRTPILYINKEECCGCTACYAICPQFAIVMTEDDEGFEYPVINKGLCIGCNMCKNVCPNKHRSSRI